MKVGVLGTGDVGQSLGRGFVTLGHEVKLGARTPNHEKAMEWAGRWARTRRKEPLPRPPASAR